MILKRLLKICLFTSSLIVVTIIIPPISLGGINLTLQTLIVMLCGLMLAPSDAFSAMGLYLLLGGMGLPIFSGMQGGVSVFLGPTGGFLLAFPIASFLISLTTKNKKTFSIFFFLLLFGIIFIYLCGAGMLSLYFKTNYFSSLLSLVVFIHFDIVKTIIAFMIFKRIKHL